MSDNVLVLMTDVNYVSKCLQTVSECRTNGNYAGDIVIIAHPDLEIDMIFNKRCKELGVHPVYFKLIDIDTIISKIKARPFSNTDGREFNKTFQWQKINIFNIFFKKWRKILYIDAGMRIIKDINILFDLVKPSVLMAHCDDYPEYRTSIATQFEKYSYPDLYKVLSDNYNLNRMSFQTTLLIFDSSIIEDDTCDKLLELANIYHISKTNEQGIMNLYFHNIWTQLPLYRDGTFIYDFWERFGNHGSNYIMLKYPRTI